MADRVDFYFRQRVTEAELDLACELLEQADRDLAADIGIYGIVTGAVPTQHSPVPDLTVDLTSPTRAYDRLGQRIFVGTDQTVDCSVDLVGIPTAVSGPANERWLAVFLRFDRQLSDPRTDGNAQQVYFRRDESFELVVRQAPEGPVGSAVRVALQQDELLVCDIRLDPDVLPFAGQSRVGRKVDELIIHESVTRSAVSTVAVLQRRKLGVHLIVAPDGRVFQHADLAHARLAHAGGHNGPSVGVEVVNPYYPYLLRDDLPWRRTIDAPWAHKDAYVLPTPEQAEATAKLIGWLASPKALGLDIPRAWIGVADGRVRMGRVDGGDQRRPGVYAHYYFGHADGAWLVLYAWLRLEVGLPPCAAYEEAVRRATGARSTIDVSDLTRSEPNA